LLCARDSSNFLDQAYEAERASLFYLDADPSADALRADPRFEVFLEKLGM